MGRVLVVDYDHSTLSAMATLLRQDGQEVDAFTSGHDAVAALRSGRIFDVIVADLELPFVDGGAVATVARELCRDACIVVTSLGRAEPLRLQKAGVCVILEKPIQYDELHQVIVACRENGGYGGSQCARHLPQRPSDRDLPIGHRPEKLHQLRPSGAGAREPTRKTEPGLRRPGSAM